MAKSSDESVAGFFRPIFVEHPNLLFERSNQELLDRWLSAHPDQKEVPKNVKSNLQNLKSVMRKTARKKRGGRPKKNTEAASVAAQTTQSVGRPRKALASLEVLEERIDDCMVMAKGIDAEALHNVYSLLRRARNAVVWMQGE